MTTRFQIRTAPRAAMLFVLSAGAWLGCSGDAPADAPADGSGMLQAEPRADGDGAASDANRPGDDPNAADNPTALDGDRAQADDEGSPNLGGFDGSGQDTADGDDPTGGQEDTPDSEDAAAADATPADAVAPELDGDVPGSEHCALVADWDPAWIAFEAEVLDLVNEVRAEGADCGSEGSFPPAEPLRMDPVLRCSARLHSLDMFERDFFDHDNPDGVSPFDRMAEAGFAGGGGGENIASGQTTPEQVMQSWMGSDGHCSNIMNAAFDALGVGFHPGAGRGVGSNLWTQNFGAPPFRPRGRR